MKLRIKNSSFHLYYLEDLQHHDFKTWWSFHYHGTTQETTHALFFRNLIVPKIIQPQNSQDWIPKANDMMMITSSPGKIHD